MSCVALVLELEAAVAETLSDRLVELGASSVSLEDADAGSEGERPIFDEPGNAPGTWPRLRLRLLASTESAGRALLEQAGAASGIVLPGPRIEPVEDLDWVEATQAQFPPIRISSRLWVVPSWHVPPEPQAINVVLDPGQAFGTGSHPSTLLCLEWLDREVQGGETLIDYGCGSGILAIAAARLGARRVIGVDIDPQALATARDNALRNAVAGEFVAADARIDVQADLVVANILANPLVLLAPALARVTRPAGRIALAGILSAQYGEVARAYEPWFTADAPAERDGWARYAGRRRAP